MTSYVGSFLKALTEGVAEGGTKQSLKQGTKTGVMSTLKSTFKIGGSKTVAKEGTEATVKEGLETVIKTEAKDGAAKVAAAFAKKNAGKIIGGVAVGTLAAVALDNFMKLNNKTYKITSITATPGPLSGATLNVTINSGGDKLLTGDDIELSGTDAIPLVNGKYKILSFKNNGSDGVVTVSTTAISLALDKNGTTGQLKYKTTFAKQLGATLGEATGDVIEVAGAAAKEISKGFFDSLGLGDYWVYILIFVGLIMGVYVLNNIIVPLATVSRSGGAFGGIFGGSSGSYSTYEELMGVA